MSIRLFVNLSKRCFHLTVTVDASLKFFECSPLCNRYNRCICRFAIRAMPTCSVCDNVGTFDQAVENDIEERIHHVNDITAAKVSPWSNEARQ